MAKAKIDFKKLMLEKGERIGVGIAGALALLLIVLSLLLPGKGLLSGSPAEKAKVLTNTAEYINRELSNPNNKPTKPDDKPDEKKAAAGLVALETRAIDGEEYRLAPLLPPVGGATLGRRVPQVFGVDEAVVRLARMQIQTYILDEATPPNIIVLKAEKESGNEKPGATGGAGAGGRIKGMFGGGMAGGMGMGKGMGMGGMGRGRGNLRRPGMLRGEAEDAKLDKRAMPISLDELDKHPDAILAEQVRPLRMAIIAASFPYKKQLEEFRAKLGLRGIAEVRAEKSTETFKGQALDAFRFLGVEVERRELDGDDKPLKKNAPNDGYEPLPLKETYGPYFVLTGGRVEPDDPDLIPLRVDGLVMPRLKQFNPDKQTKSGAGGMAGPNPGGGFPAPGMKGATGAKEKPARTELTKDHYPALEKELPTIRKTIESLRSKTATVVTAPPTRFRGMQDVFSNPEAAPKSDGLGPTGRPDAGKTGDPKDGAAAEEVIPDHCLVRAIDVTIEPGKFYEYRLRIVMANPNVGRPDVANPSSANDKVLKPSAWSTTPLRIHVDPELHYYAVDQRQLELPAKYTGLNQATRIDEEKQVWLQAHRWLETVPLPSDLLFIGEWAIAERFVVFRGEYATRPLPVQVPYWRYTREDFLIADDGTNRRRGAKPQMLIDFGYNAGGAQPEAIVVDFQNGKRSIDKVTSRTDDGKVTTARVTDEAGEEVLLLEPNGKLMLLEGAFDATDPKRKARLEHVRKRIREVEESGKKGGGGGGDKPFGS